MLRAFYIYPLLGGLLVLITPGCLPDDGEPTEPIVQPDAGAMTTTKAALGQACKVASDCESAQCFVGGQFSYCSLKCGTATAMTVCVPPVFNGVCNKQGFCRRP